MIRRWFIWNWGDEGDKIYAIVVLVVMLFSILIVTSFKDWKYMDNKYRALAGARFRCLGVGVWFSILVCLCLVLVWEIW